MKCDPANMALFFPLTTLHTHANETHCKCKVMQKISVIKMYDLQICNVMMR